MRKLLPLLALVSMAAASCGKTSSCSKTCQGCCGPAGACITVESDLTCGSGGVACVDCSLQAASCNTSTHVCEGGAGGGGGGGNTCTPSTCPGCCSNGICLPFSAQGAGFCGLGGTACKPCSLGEGCQQGKCVMETPSVTGQTCRVGPDCGSLGSGADCRMSTPQGGYTYPGGYCTRPCTTQSDCAHDALCVRPPPGETGNLCLQRCLEPGTQSSCRDQYFCIGLTVGSEGVCWLLEPFLPDAGPPFDKVGSPCTTDSTCDPSTAPGSGTGICIPEMLDGGSTGFTGGYCTGDCSVDPRVCSADGGALCVELTSSSSICEKSCAAPWLGQSDCRTGYVCYGVVVRSADGGTRPSPTGVCHPRCENAGTLYTCGTGAYCDAGYCTR